MNETARLERWYRRMLTWYPAEHRRAYGEEMIGVLLASAPQGKRRPGIADTLDLVKGGLLARLRPPSGDTDAGWRDTFAVFSIAAPAMAVAYALGWAAVRIAEDLRFRGTFGSTFAAYAVWQTLFIFLVIALASAIPPLLALAPRLRWLAVGAAAAEVILFCYQMIGHFQWADARLIWYSIFFALELVALAISPGPRRGARIMTRPAWAVTAGPAILAGLSIVALYRNAIPVLVVSTLVAMVAAVIGLVLTLPAPIGARLLLLLAIPGYPAVIALTGVGEIQVNGWENPSGLALLWLPTIALVGLVAVLAWRSRHRGSAASQHRGSAAS